MKKQTKKLSLGKKTISNLKPPEMDRVIGASGCPYSCSGHGGKTVNGNSCTGGYCNTNHTCYPC